MKKKERQRVFVVFVVAEDVLRLRAEASCRCDASICLLRAAWCCPRNCRAASVACGMETRAILEGFSVAVVVAVRQHRRAMIVEVPSMEGEHEVGKMEDWGLSPVNEGRRMKVNASNEPLFAIFWHVTRFPLDDSCPVTVPYPRPFFLECSHPGRSF
jgi:hypothetical protein